MTVSYITADRTASRAATQRGGKPMLRDARRLSDRALVEKLGGMGIPMSKESLRPLCDRYASAEELSRQLAGSAGVSGLDTDWVWLCLTVLWERWFPHIPNLEIIDDKAQLGYARMEQGKVERACDLWTAYWHDVLWLVQRWDIRSIAEFDKRFVQTEFLYNWCNDFEMELGNAGIRNPAYRRRRLEFCRQVVSLADAGDTLFVGNIRRATAEALSALGDKAGAERLYQEWLEKDPRWGWGWIGWSDLWGLFSFRDPDYARAEELLFQGLAVQGVRGREFLRDRLSDLREHRRQQDRKRRAEVRGKRTGGPSASGTAEPSESGPVRSAKIGRNEPCPCGSGRKYKVCCGK